MKRSHFLLATFLSAFAIGVSLPAQEEREPGTFVEADFDRPSQQPGSDLGTLYDNDWGAYWARHSNANPGTPTVEDSASTGYEEIRGQFARIARSHEERDSGNDVMTRGLSQALARDGDSFRFAVKIGSYEQGSGWFVAQMQLQSTTDWIATNNATIGVSHAGWRVLDSNAESIEVPGDIPQPEPGEWYWMRATVHDTDGDGRIDSYTVTVFDAEMEELGTIDDAGEPITFIPNADWHSEAGPPEALNYMTMRGQGPGAFDVLIDEITISIVDDEAPLEGKAAWRLEHFGTEEDAGEAAMAADPDGDGVANLLEYALGGDPNTPDRSVLPVTGTVTEDGIEYLTFSFERPSPAPEDIAYIPEASSDLLEWGEVELEVESSPNGDGMESLFYRSAEPLGDEARYFIRLRVEVLE